MGTTYTIKCTSASGNTSNIALVDSTMPLNDSWSAAVEAEWDARGGPAIRSGDDVHLMGMGASPVAFLYGLANAIRRGRPAGSSGEGEKQAQGGTFPDGSIRWTVTRVD